MQSALVPKTKEELKKTYEGWKLLISVDPGRIQEAREIVIPVTRLLGCFHTWMFNANPQAHATISLKRVGLEVSRFSNPEIYVQPLDAARMIRQIDGALNREGISPGIKPNAWAQTFSPYFSLRNESLAFPLSYPLLLDKAARDFIEEKGNHFNPANAPNPYANLLSEPRAFHLLSHFTSLPIKSAAHALMNLRLSLFAYLREYTHIDTLNEKEREEFTRQCFARHTPLESYFIQSFHPDIQSEQDIKTAMILLDWTFHLNTQAVELNLPAFSGSDLFVQLTKCYNDVLLSPEKESSVQAVNTFEEFLQHKRESTAENWINHQCELIEEDKSDSISHVLESVIKRGDYYQCSAAIKKLKGLLDVHHYQKTLLALDKHPLAKMELADLFIHEYVKLGYERPLTYRGMTYLKQVLMAPSVDADMEGAVIDTVNRFWHFLNQLETVKPASFLSVSQKGSDMLINTLSEIAKSGHRTAQFILACFLCSDLNVDEIDNLVFKGRRDHDYDHEEAKKYFLQIAADQTVSEKVRSRVHRYLDFLSRVKSNPVLGLRG